MRAVEDDTPDPLASVDRTRVSVAVGRLTGPVLSRIVGIHAARAGLPVDRLADAVLIADAVAGRAPAFTVGDRLSVSVQSTQGHLGVRIGPLRPGGGRRALQDATLPDVGSVIERLADTVRIRAAAGGDEYLVIRIDCDAGRASLPLVDPTGDAS